MSEPIMTVQCIERAGPVMREVRPTKLSMERLKFLWNKLSKFDVLYNDFTRGSLEAFTEHFISQDATGELHPAGLMWDVDDVGILILKEVKPHVSAEAHYIFWDEIFFGREELCRRMLRYAFEKFYFQRIYTIIPIHATRTLNAVERIGMVHEGRLRNAVLYEGKWFDANIYGVLPTDLDDKHKPFRQGMDARFICRSCGERLTKKESVHGTKHQVG